MCDQNEIGDQKKLLQEWRGEAEKSAVGHLRSGEYLEKWRIWLGIPAVVLSAIVGSTVFATILNSSSKTAIWAVVVTALAVTSGVLTALQSFLDLGTTAEKHRRSNASYKGVVRRIDVALLKLRERSTLSSEELNGFDNEMKNLETDSPIIRPRIRRNVESNFERES